MPNSDVLWCCDASPPYEVQYQREGWSGHFSPVWKVEQTATMLWLWMGSKQGPAEYTGLPLAGLHWVRVREIKEGHGDDGD